MTNPEPLRGSALPQRPPARLLGADEVDRLLAMQGDEDTDEEEDEDAPSRD